ncbi:MAG: large conductance mechanosensitive channel protein MscL [Bacteroidetes bacterium]|nr:large conductance mechanosensitive channel protein MscL [Bacteroidota bacterium]MBS1629306.1 large conductance mechanosensitive channel protein MscL [Bacteroidota bacterium]
MGFLKEFKEFALKGNVVDLAIAVIIGAAFGAIVSSLTDDVITPLLLQPALKAAGVQDLDKLTWGAVKYGNFLAAVLKFILIAFVLFLLMKFVASLIRKKEEAPAPPPAPSSTDQLLMEIRDELRRKG